MYLYVYIMYACVSRYDLILFPAARHGPQRLSDRAYLEEACLQFVEDRVKDQRAALLG
jgi:hypothetical protein